MNRMRIYLREAQRSDLRFLREMLYEGVFWRANADRPSFKEGLAFPGVKKELADWGERDGDTAVVDYGFQGEKYKFTDEDDFIMASFVLSWDLFKGFQNKAKIQQAAIDKQIIETKYKEAENQIKLQVINSYYELEAAEKAITAAKQQTLSAKKSFEIIDKKYKEGQANLIQFIDARTTMTNAEYNVIITTYDYKIKYAEFERTTCLYNIVE